MTATPTTAVKDSNYDLIAVVQASLHYVWQMETFADDAQRQGDEELATWFRAIQHNNQKAAEQGKKLLQTRLQTDGG